MRHGVWGARRLVFTLCEAVCVRRERETHIYTYIRTYIRRKRKGRERERERERERAEKHTRIKYTTKHENLFPRFNYHVDKVALKPNYTYHRCSFLPDTRTTSSQPSKSSCPRQPSVHNVPKHPQVVKRVSRASAASVSTEWSPSHSAGCS